MIRRDPTACFETAPSGCNFFAPSGIRLRAGNVTWEAITQKQYNEILAYQRSHAIIVGTLRQKARTYWMFQGQFYWEDEGYKAR